MEWLHIYKHAQYRMKELFSELESMTEGDKHTVMLYNGTRADLDENTETFDADKAGLDKLFDKMEQADRIVWHGFDWGPDVVVRLWRKRHILKKSIWHVEYGDVVHLPYKGQKLHKKAYFRIKDAVRNNMSAYAVESWEAFYQIKSEFGADKNVFLTGNAFDGKLAKCLENMTRTEKTEATVHVLIGNGNYPGMKHMDVIKLLAKYMYEDIQIHIPMYGPAVNRKYAEKVRTCARGYFGPKAKFYDKELSAEEYAQLLNKMDVGIYFCEVQNAYRDILALRYLGKKVYCADRIRNNYQLAEVESRLGHIASISKCSFAYFANYVEKIPQEEMDELLKQMLEERSKESVSEKTEENVSEETKAEILDESEETASEETKDEILDESEETVLDASEDCEEEELPEIPDFRIIYPDVDREKVFAQIKAFDQWAGWEKLVEYINAPDKKSEDVRIPYLHLIPPRYTIIYPFMEMSQKFFAEGEHHFLVTTPHLNYAPKLVAQPYTEFEMGKTRRARLKHMFSRLRAADHVVFHSLYISKPEALALALRPSILKKAAWIEWGKDLYDYKLPENSLMNRLMNRVHTRIRENVNCYVSIFEPDAKKFRELFSDSKAILQTNYTAYNSIEMLERTRPTEEEEGERPLRIQVGHSCNSWGNHDMLLNSLAMFKFEDIQLEIPLSLGAPPSNKKKISSYATALFGNKAHFLWDEMEKEDYFRFLWSVDIAVFGLYRQAGLGNIIRLLYMGKKVFLPKNSVMYNFFTENGVEIYDTEEIQNMSYEEFAAPLKTQTPHPFIVKMMHQDDLVKAWSAVFQYLKNNTK